MAIPTPIDDEAHAAARFNMVACQLRPGGLRDERLARRLEAIPRELFVASACRDIAYAERVLPCGAGTAMRDMLSPLAFARLVELAAITPDDVVLDIAGGTGYSAAIMAGLASTVIALEEHETFSLMADGIWRDLNIDNAVAVTAPLTDGVPKQAPFNVIFINGCVETVPPPLLDQLDEGGRLICVQEIEGSPKAMLWHRVEGSMALPKFDISAPLLPQFATPPRFTF